MQRKVRVDQPVYSVNDCLLASDINSVLQSTLIQPGVMLQKALWHSPLVCADIMCWRGLVGPGLPAGPTPWSYCREKHETTQCQEQNVSLWTKLCVYVCVCVRLTRRRRHWQSFCCQSECSAPTPHDLPALANMPHTLCPITCRKRSISNISPYSLFRLQWYYIKQHFYHNLVSWVKLTLHS